MDLDGNPGANGLFKKKRSRYGGQLLVLSGCAPCIAELEVKLNALNEELKLKGGADGINAATLSAATRA